MNTFNFKTEAAIVFLGEKLKSAIREHIHGTRCSMSTFIRQAVRDKLNSSRNQNEIRAMACRRDTRDDNKTKTEARTAEENRP